MTGARHAAALRPLPGWASFCSQAAVLHWSRCRTGRDCDEEGRPPAARAPRLLIRLPDRPWPWRVPPPHRRTGLTVHARVDALPALQVRPLADRREAQLWRGTWTATTTSVIRLPGALRLNWSPAHGRVLAVVGFGALRLEVGSPRASCAKLSVAQRRAGQLVVNNARLPDLALGAGAHRVTVLARRPCRTTGQARATDRCCSVHRPLQVPHQLRPPTDPRSMDPRSNSTVVAPLPRKDSRGATRSGATSAADSAPRSSDANSTTRIFSGARRSVSAADRCARCIPSRGHPRPASPSRRRARWPRCVPVPIANRARCQPEPSSPADGLPTLSVAGGSAAEGAGALGFFVALSAAAGGGGVVFGAIGHGNRLGGGSAEAYGEAEHAVRLPRPRVAHRQRRHAASTTASKQRAQATGICAATSLATRAARKIPRPGETINVLHGQNAKSTS